MRNQRGIALPIALIMFIVMMLGSLYLVRSSTSGALVVGNMAYQKTLSRVSDTALMQANGWLGTTHGNLATKVSLDESITAQGYVAFFDFTDPRMTPSDSKFWTGSIVVNVAVPGGELYGVEYIIHRLCSQVGSVGAPGQRCAVSSPPPTPLGTKVKTGESLATEAEEYITPPQFHYQITSRVVSVNGHAIPKGAAVVNQLVVMMGA